MNTNKWTNLNQLTRIYFLAACSMGLFATAYAQQDNTPVPGRSTVPDNPGVASKPGVVVGLKGGLNFTNLYMDDEIVDEQKFKYGFQGGLFVKIPVLKFLAIQPELLYSNQGNLVERYNNLTLFKSPGQVRYNLNYLSMPVLAVLNLGPLNVHAGPYVAYLLSANVTDLKANDATGANATEIRLSRKNFKTLDYGLMGGIGLDIEKFHIGARVFAADKRDISRDVVVEGQSYRPAKGAKNFGAQLYVGLSL